MCLYEQVEHDKSYIKTSLFFQSNGDEWADAAVEDDDDDYDDDDDGVADDDDGMVGIHCTGSMIMMQQGR